jgi:hypothetical protein
MNKIGLHRKFSEELNSQQKGVLREYHRLLSTPSTLASMDEEIRQIEQIWEKAKDDPVLRKGLELIDHFCTNAPEFSSPEDNNKRAYYSEHLDTLLEQKTNADRKQRTTDSNPERDDFYVFNCPDYFDQFELLLTNEKRLPEVKEQRCSRCKKKLSDHKITVLKHYPSKKS